MSAKASDVPIFFEYQVKTGMGGDCSRCDSGDTSTETGVVSYEPKLPQ